MLARVLAATVAGGITFFILGFIIFGLILDPLVMKPGTRVRAVLELENLANAFTIPRQAMFEKEGKKIVYRKRGSSFEPVEITIASSSAGRVVVTRGLNSGDQLALTDPNAKKDEG